LSVVLAPVEPPPDTDTEFTCGEAALPATLTVTVITAELEPLAKASARLQAVETHVQPVPDMDASVSPEGTVSVTVTVPLVDAVPLLVTVPVKVAPFCPFL